MRGLRPLMASPTCEARLAALFRTATPVFACTHPLTPSHWGAFVPVKLHCSGRGMIDEGAAPPHGLPHLRGQVGGPFRAASAVFACAYPYPSCWGAFPHLKLHCRGRGMIDERAARPHGLPHLRGRVCCSFMGLLRQCLPAPTLSPSRWGAFGPVKLHCSGWGMIDEGAAHPHGLPHLRGRFGGSFMGLHRQCLPAPTLSPCS